MSGARWGCWPVTALWLLATALPAAAQQSPAPPQPSTTAPPKHKPKPKPTPVVQGAANTHAKRPASPPPPAPAPEPATPVETKGSVTGLPLPRWAALRSDEVNLRVGPGTRFPIDWQYHRRDLPVHILRENDVWRLIEDQDGVKGWVHQATLVGHRGFVVQGLGAALRRTADDAAAAVAELKPGVVGRIRACEATAAWCEVQVGDYSGWLKREQFYGTAPGEAVGN